MSEWKVSSNHGAGIKYFQVYRILRENEVDHSGNREYYPGIFSEKRDAQAVADELNKK